jgi:hypothetical protein
LLRIRSSAGYTIDTRESRFRKRHPAQLLQPLKERSDTGLKFRIVRGCGQENADAPHPFGRLRARRKRPGSRRAAEQRNEIVVS